MNKIMPVNYIHKQRKVCELKHDHDYVYEYNEIIMSYQVYELTHKHELDHGTNELTMNYYMNIIMSMEQVNISMN